MAKWLSETLEFPSVEVLQMQLDKTLSSLLKAGPALGTDQVAFRGLFQPTQFCNWDLAHTHNSSFQDSLLTGVLHFP